jgi:D-serine deaminase-like pyridoxal phosphate-dependent protein
MTIATDVMGLKTPCLLLDVRRVRRNAARVSEIAKRNGVRLRPHVKTHKCVEVARIATEGHDGAVTTSTLAEVKAFARHGFNDFTYAVPIERGKFDDVVEILRNGVRLNVLTDDLETIRLLGMIASRNNVKIPIFLKVDSGYHRCGVDPHSEEAVTIPRAIADASHLEFAGILTHAGHSYHARSNRDLQEIARGERDIMSKLAECLRDEGVDVPTVSIGSTPTINHVDHLDGIDEVRPGNYVFFDAYQATLGSCEMEDCALTVLTAVTHRSFDQKKVVVDAGAIALSKDRGPVEFDPACGFGRVLDLDGRELNLRVDSLSQEHGTIHVADDATLGKLPVGARLRILSNHSCMASAQHSHFNVWEDGAIVDKWEIHRGW